MKVSGRYAFTCYAVILPALALLLSFVYLPMLWAFSKSLYQFEIGAGAEFVGLLHYKEYLFGDPTMGLSMFNMGALTLFHVVVRLTVPLVVAKLIYSLTKEGTRHAYRVLFLAPIVVPGVASQLIWQSLILSDHGLLNETLRLFGLGALTHGWLSSAETALGALMFVGFPYVSGFDVLIYYAGLANVPDDVNEACALEGCTGVKKFFLIDVPLVMSQLKLILILTVIHGLQGFEGILVLTNGGPGFETMVPGLWMYLNAFSFQRMGYACAIGVVLFVMIFALTVINFRYFRSAEDMKG